MSILSFPERGPWGDAKWRGNCSGHIYKALFEQIKPTFFVDPMMGSGTSIEVATEMGIPCVGLDLHQGFNILTRSILSAVGREADFVCSHPPYGSMILYSNGVWGDKPHPGDLSRCASDEEFCEKMQQALLNQREATTPGGVYGTIIGDLRKDGRYKSYQAEFIARMPASELASVIIKAQHNTMSGGKQYAKMKFPFITHEYVILWMKPKQTISLLSTLAVIAKEQDARLQGSWRSIVKQVLVELGGSAELSRIYQAISKARPEQLTSNSNWQAKVRQTLQLGPFASEQRGEWALA